MAVKNAIRRTDTEFLPELVCIVEDEIVRAIQAERARLLEQLRRPGTS